MKSIYLTTLLMLFVTCMYAQFNAGDKVLGGSLSLNISSTKEPPYENSLFSIGLSPSYARFKNSNTAIGFRVIGQYSNRKSETPINYPRQKAGNIGAGFFGQRYFFIGTRFFVVGELGVNALYNWTKDSYADDSYSKSKGYSGSVYLTPGLGVKLSNHFLLDLSLNSLASLSYNHTKVQHVTSGQEVGKSTMNSFSLSSNLNGNTLNNLSVGFRWLM